MVNGISEPYAKVNNLKNTKIELVHFSGVGDEPHLCSKTLKPFL